MSRWLWMSAVSRRGKSDVQSATRSRRTGVSAAAGTGHHPSRQIMSGRQHLPMAGNNSPSHQQSESGNIVAPKRRSGKLQPHANTRLDRAQPRSLCQRRYFNAYSAGGRSLNSRGSEGAVAGVAVPALIPSAPSPSPALVLLRDQRAASGGAGGWGRRLVLLFAVQLPHVDVLVALAQ